MSVKKQVSFGPVVQHTVERYLDKNYTPEQKADWVFNELTKTLDTPYYYAMVLTLETQYFRGDIPAEEYYCYRDIYPWQENRRFDQTKFPPPRLLHGSAGERSVLVMILADGDVVSWSMYDLLSRGSQLAAQVMQRTRPRMHSRMTAWAVLRMPAGVTADDILTALRWIPQIHRLTEVPEAWYMIGLMLGLDYLHDPGLINIIQTEQPRALQRQQTSYMLNQLEDMAGVAVASIHRTAEEQQTEALVEQFQALDARLTTEHSTDIV